MILYLILLYVFCSDISHTYSSIIQKYELVRLDGNQQACQVQKIPNLAYQIYQTLQIYWVYEKDYIKYKYDRKWKTENMAEKHNFHK